MTPRFALAIAIACLLFPALGAAAEAPTPASADAATQPADDTFEGYVLIEDWSLPLRLSGSGVVSRRYLPFYAVGLYVGRGPVDGAELARGMTPCRVAIHWLVPQVAAADAESYWREQLAKAVPDPMARQRLDAAFARLAAAFGEAKRGDTLLLDYHPERGLRVWRNGVVAGQFAGLEFNRAVLALWLGQHVPSDLRNALLGVGSALDAAQ
ncbi:MAG TPA: chalcone isomerase family protein [Xanthomonadales bacterium]|nr:chalcone isomerase family protein [Xanthomonadales bacterium]